MLRSDNDRSILCFGLCSRLHSEKTPDKIRENTKLFLRITDEADKQQGIYYDNGKDKIPFKK